MYYTSDHLYGTPFDLLKWLHIFPVLGMDAVLHVTSYESRSEVDNLLPHPAVHIYFDAA